jgi:hypothetical protein
MEETRNTYVILVAITQPQGKRDVRVNERILLKEILNKYVFEDGN